MIQHDIDNGKDWPLYMSSADKDTITHTHANTIYIDESGLHSKNRKKGRKKRAAGAHQENEVCGEIVARAQPRVQPLHRNEVQSAAAPTRLSRKPLSAVCFMSYS